MAIRVEFYGIPRQRAEVAAIDVDAQTLAEALAETGRLLPNLAVACFDDGHLGPGYLASINGKTFTTNPAEPLKPGDCVLILSAEVGG